MRIVSFFILIPLLAMVAAAQSESRLQGTVFDQNGAVVLATEIVTIQKGKTQVVATTDDEGRYSAKIPKGRYTLEIRHKGGHFCPIRLVNYEVVGPMFFDFVIDTWRSSQDSGECKIKKIQF